MIPVDYSYNLWKPWNDGLVVEKLRPDFVKLYKQQNEEGIIRTHSEDSSEIFIVKIDGNRRVKNYKKNLSTFRAEIDDLKIQKQFEENP